MSVGDSLRKNLHFWHWYPRILCEGLSEDQLYWQPEKNPNHIIFAIWHAYRSEDDIIHELLLRRKSVFATQGWEERLPVAEAGRPPYGTGLDRAQIAEVRVDPGTLFTYADAVGHAVQEYADGLSEAEGAEKMPTPWFQPVYPMLDEMSKTEIFNFFCIGHVAEHLGEVQYIKGLLGLQGAPL
ncbi:MAG TPA: DinB family protein [Dehalococcoidia bacterium]|nr:DinB family protein [Dehalococcoidia bacterium]